MRESAVVKSRLAAQALAPRVRSVEEAARRLLCMQGQDLAAVKWALAVRTDGATERDVEAAFNSRALVRSWPLRGTLHALPAEDLGWILGLTHQKNLSKHVKRHRDLGLTDDDFARTRAVAERELAKSPLTREELLGAFERAKVSTAGQRGIHLIWKLAQRSVLCLADFVDGDQRFALIDDWIRKPRQLTGDEALAELAARYFEGHGPATLEDFEWWCGLKKSDCVRAIKSAESAGVMAAASARIERALQRKASAKLPPALLLPGFDEYFLGYTDRSAVLEAKYFERIVPGGNGVFQPMIVLHGRVVGTWRRKVDKKKVTLTLLPFAKKFTGTERAAIDSAARTFGAYLERDVALA